MSQIKKSIEEAVDKLVEVEQPADFESLTIMGDDHWTAEWGVSVYKNSPVTEEDAKQIVQLVADTTGKEIIGAATENAEEYHAIAIGFAGVPEEGVQEEVVKSVNAVLPEGYNEANELV